MKKLISFALIFALVFVPLAACDSEQAESSENVSESVSESEIPADESSEYISENDFEYEISEDGSSVYITKYIGTSESVVVPSVIDGLPVVSLVGVSSAPGVVEDGVFENSNVKSVTISDGIRIIGKRAFKDCGELNTVILNDDIDKICAFAFLNCVSLEEVDLSGTRVETIFSRAFENCAGLKSVLFPDTLTRIEKRAFYGCESLVSATLPKNLEELESEAFSGCLVLEKVSVPTNLNLDILDVPPFYNVPSLKSVVFEEGRERLSGYSFFNFMADVEITVPSSVKIFSFYTFFGKGITAFVFSGDCPSIEESGIDHFGAVKIKYDPSKNGWDDCEWKDSKDLYSGIEMIFEPIIQ